MCIRDSVMAGGMDHGLGARQQQIHPMGGATGEGGDVQHVPEPSHNVVRGRPVGGVEETVMVQQPGGEVGIADGQR